MGEWFHGFLVYFDMEERRRPRPSAPIAPIARKSSGKVRFFGGWTAEYAEYAESGALIWLSWFPGVRCRMYRADRVHPPSSEFRRGSALWREESARREGRKGL